MGVGCAVLGFSFVTGSVTSWLPSGERPRYRSFTDQLRDVSFNERYFDANKLGRQAIQALLGPIGPSRAVK